MNGSPDILKMPSPMEEKTIGQRLADLKIEASAVLTDLEDEEQPENENFDFDRDIAIEFLDTLGELSDPPPEIASLVVACDLGFAEPSALRNAYNIADQLSAIDEAIPMARGRVVQRRIC